MEHFRLLTKTRQVTEYSCGACALQAVLSYWGKNVDETELMKLIHTTPEEGTYPQDIVRGARFLGFEAQLKDNLTLEEVARFTVEGDPMIAVAQVWRNQKETSSVEEDWDNGHYIVVLGVDNNYVYFQDPYIRMSKAFISRKTFEEHWHQVMGGDVKHNPKLIHLGIFIRGTKRAAPKLGKQLTFSGLDFRAFGSLNLIITQFSGVLLPYDFLDELRDIWSRGDVRPDAFIFLAKDKDGTLRGIESSQLQEEEDISAINAVIAAITARSVGSPELSPSAAEASIAAAAAGDFGLSAGDIHRIAKKLPPDHSAIIVLCENVWERRFKEVANRYKGAIINQRLISPGALAKAATELTRGTEPS
jgi:predicted double-glycine peptidase